jgi:hypothetical protein
MARPATGRTGKKVTLSLSVEIYAAARKLSEATGRSVSEIVDRLLVAELKRKRGIVHLHPRTLEEKK